MGEGGTFEGGKRVAQGSGAVQEVGVKSAKNTPTISARVPLNDGDP